jgi:uncharacterized membrane protein YqaE (UPF0057 family)
MSSLVDYVLAVILPPLVVLTLRKPTQFFLNLVLTCCGWLPGVIHAMYLVRNFHEDDCGPRRLGRDMRQHQLNSILR